LLGVDNFPPPLNTLPELAGRIKAVTVTKVWTELEYGYDMFRANHDTLPEHM
jgi:hypothetical protein